MTDQTIPADKVRELADKEVWRQIPGFEGFYEVSSLGRVKSVTRTIDRVDGSGLPLRERILCIFVDTEGRERVNLFKSGRKKGFFVHTLVAMAFYGERPDGTECCHWDGNPRNNRVENLRWASHADNMRDLIRHGTHHNTVKNRCKRGHKLELPNLDQSKLAKGRRQCAACLYGHRWMYEHPNESRTFEEIANEKYESIMGDLSL